jgi:hypothetical protein
MCIYINIGYMYIWMDACMDVCMYVHMDVLIYGNVKI